MPQPEIAKSCAAPTLGFLRQEFRPLVLGITGGMGCGKSTAARLFEARGWRRIDTDALVRERALTAPDVQEAIIGRFGPVMVAGGNVDRRALADRIFNDDSARLWLEELVHPHVFAAWRSLLASEPHGPWIVETPLLFEGGLEIWFDFTVCVACSGEQQLARLEQRGLDRALAGQRISKQLPLARKIDLAEYVLWNDGSMDFLQEQIDRLLFSFPKP